MISIKQLHYALAVERALNFKKAAEACFVSQSALSTALSELEKQLGFQVFERDNKKVLVTPLGRQVLDKARDIKLQTDDLMSLAESQYGTLCTPLSVGIIPTICPYILPLILPAIAKHFPKLQLKVIEEPSQKLVDMLRAGELDTALLALPYPTDGLLSFPFWEEDFYWVSHSDNPLSSKNEISAEQLHDTQLMLLQDGHCLKDHALSACQFQAQDVHSLSATSLQTLVQLIVGRMGSTLVPHIAIQQLVAPHSELCKVHLQEPGPHRSFTFLVRPNYPNLDNVEQLKNLCQQTLSEHLDSK